MNQFYLLMTERNSRKRDTSLTPENAKRQQLSQQEDSDSSSDDESDFGQRTPPLIDYIKGILNNYPDGSQILKEIIQNADDAGATKVAFLLDYTTHSTNGLIHQKCSLYQGHALYAWNNAAFKSADWEGIRNVGISGKASDTMKVGRFGLGFVTVYHITDVPVILSDRFIGVLDPQQQIFPDKPGRKFKLKNFFRNSKYSSHQETFLSYFDYDGSRRYNGTIFRFPLRDSHSNSAIKPSGLYTAESVMDKLFKPLMKEADNVLIFLKSVKSIELYTKSDLKSEPRRIFYVNVPQNYLQNVIDSNRLLSRHVEDGTFHNSILVTINLYPITSLDCGEDRVWLVLNMIGFPQSHSLSAFYTEHKLTYLPWIGIAIETGISSNDLHASETINFRRDWDGIDIQGFIDGVLTEFDFSFTIPTKHHLALDSGKLFCFLPTPEHTDLPVNIHGYFALTNDRRQIKWPSLDSKDTDSNWNKLLVEQLGVSAYVIFYNILVHLIRQENPEYYQYRMLGGENLKKQSLILVNQGLEILANQKIVYCYVIKRWIQIGEGIYQPSGYTNSQKEIRDLLEVLREPLVLLSTSTLAVFSRVRSLREAIQRNTISPVIIRRLLRKHSNDTQLTEFFAADITGYTSVILAYAVSNLSLDCNVVRELEGIPLLQLANRDIVKFADSSHKFYLYDDKFNLIKLFPGLEHLFVDPDIPQETYSLLFSFSKLPSCEINLRDISDIKTDLTLLKQLFQLSITSHFGNSNSPLDWNPNHSAFNCDWVKLIWSLIGSDSSLATSLRELPLLPRYQLSSHTNQLLSVVSADYILHSTDNKYASLQSLLTECSSVFIHSHRFIESLDDLVISPLPGGLLPLLHTNTRILTKFIDKLKQTSDKRLSNLIIEILNGSSTLNKSQIQLIKKLPIFPTLNGTYISLVQSFVRVPDNIHLPRPHVSYPNEYLSPDNPPTNLLYEKLGVCATDINGFVRNNILCFINDLNASDHFKLSKWLLNTLEKMDSITINKLREFIWIVDNTSESIEQPKGHRRPNQLFCHADDDTLSALLPHNSKYFAHQGYDSYSYITKKNSLFLSSSCLANQKIFEEVTESAVQCFYLDTQDPNCSSLWKKRFSTLLKFVTNCWQTQKLQMNIISKTLQSFPIVLPSYTRPDGYPKSLPFLGRNELTRLRSVLFCSKQDISLVGSVRVCVPFSQYTLLLGYLGCKTAVTGAMIVEQLNFIVECDIQSADFENINSLLNKIYLSKLILDNSHDIVPRFVYVKLKNIFIEAKQVVRSSEVCLEPFYYSFERLNYSVDTWPLLVKCGAHEKISNKEYYEILHRLYEGQNMESKPECVELIINVIVILYKSNYKYIDGVAFLLGTDEFLHPATECVYHDVTIHYEKKQVENKGITYHIVHSRIPRCTASKFGAKSLKITMLGGFWKYKGQYEKLTTRLRSILKEYESKIDVFKELLQNADDAKASTVKLLIDYTSHSSRYLIKTDMKAWQGPALYFYNDAQFSEEDFENIMKIFGETKLRDTSKIGKYGLGFNTVYHLTDLPSFVSGKYIHMLDPTRSFLVDPGQEPGIQVDLVCSRDGMLNMYEDQFSVFNLELFNCNVFNAEPFNGTLFRLPFRTKSSDISDTVYVKSVIEDLLSQILQQAESSILFLQHIKCIEIYRRKEGSDPKLLLKVSKNELTNPFEYLETFNSKYKEDIAHIVAINSAVSYYNQRICITCEDTLHGKKKNEFIVSYSTGTQQCADFLRNKDTSRDNYTPVSSVALPLSTIREYSHDTPAYNLYCYLPLPVTSPYLMYINGFFALDHSRRGIACTEDDSDRMKWNVALISDALVNALINLFLHTREYFSYQNLPLSRFYRLWPLDKQPQSIVWREFPKAFATRLMEENASLFYCESHSDTWISYRDASFLYYEDCYDHDSLRIFYDFVRCQLLHYSIYLVDISVSLQEYHLFQIIFENDKDKLYRLEMICSKYIFPNIHTLRIDEVKLVLTSLLPIINNTKQIWLQNLFSKTPCIPSGRMTLLLPSRVVSPHSPLVKLYSPSDERTVHPDLKYLFERSSKYLISLRKLDIIEYTLPEEDIIDRCKCQVNFQDNQRRIEHCMLILKYINDKQSNGSLNNNLKTQLSEVEFIPVWEDTFLIQIGLQVQTRFARPNKCYPYSLRDITSPGYYAITEEVDKFNYLKTFLSVNRTKDSVTIQDLIGLLEAIRGKKDEIITLNLQDEISRRAEIIYKMIFCHWKKDNSIAINRIRHIWHSGVNSFCPLSHLFISAKYSHYNSVFLATFPYKLTNISDLQEKFLITLGVQKNIYHKDVYRILTEMAGYYDNGANTPEKVVNLVIDLTNEYFVNCADYRFSNKPNRVLLSSELRLCAASTLYIDDMPWVVNEEINITSQPVVHQKIHPASAYNLGAKSSRSNHFDELEFEQFGQHEDIADRIRGLKREFPCGTTILKELLQNAEDAGATEVAFVLDNTDYSFKIESLCLSKEMHPNWHRYQNYTSLLVYNNSSFSEKDLEGIQKVGLGGKKGMQTIGKFGLGFNAVYHLTDSPCLLTRRNSDENISFCVFDPFRKFLRLKPGSLPGRRLNFDSKKFKQFPDQFSPYSLQSLNTNFFPTLTKGEYTIFRLPFTDLNVSRTVEKILSDFLQNSCNLNLFLENVHQISVFSRNTNKSEMLGTFKLSITSLPLYTPPPSFECKFLSEIKISKREISIDKSTVISQAEVVSSLGKRSRTDSTSSTWLLFTNKGSIQSLESCCPSMKKHRSNYENEKLTHEVYGGVAVNLTTNSTTGSCLYSYLPIGDDRPMNFPILINAPFILEPERQHIRFRDVEEGETSWEDEWHSVIIQHVIAPLFASLLIYLRSDRGITNQNNTSDYYSWYYTLYPDVIHLNKVNQVFSNFIYAVCKQLYTLLYHSNEQILANQSCTNFYNLFGDNEGIFPDTPTLPLPIYPVTSIQYSPLKRIRNDIQEDDLYSTLNKLNFPLTCAPNHVKSSFEEFSFSLTILSQSILLNYLNLKTDLSKCTMSDIEILLDYLFKANSNITDKYQKIPLKIDYKGGQGHFTKTDITFCSHYADLLPQCAHRFINPLFPNASIELLKKHGYIQKMTPDFLSGNLQISEFTNTECCLFWKFILESQLPSHKLIPQFSKFPLIPIIGKSSYTLISNLPAILSQSIHFVIPLIRSAMVKLQCLQLDLNIPTTPSLNVSELTKYLQPLTISNVVSLYQFLSAVKLSDVDIENVDLSKNEVSSILNLFSNIELSPLNYDENMIISKLKIFSSHLDTLCSITHFNKCFINTSSFKIGLTLSNMLTRDKITIFKNNHEQNVIIKHVINTCHITQLISETDFFLNYVLRYFTQLDIVEQREILLFFQSISKPFKNDFINKLKCVKFIRRGSDLVTVSDCYSPEVELFKVYFPTELLPVEWSDTLVSYYSILSELGLRNKADLQSIVTAAERIADEKSILSPQQKLIPLSSLVSVIQRVRLNSHEISLLQRLSKIKFLPAWKYISNSKNYIQKYLSFNEAELHEHTYSCCMATYIHDPLVYKCLTEIHNSAGSYLNIRPKPDVHTVLTHLELICKEFNQVRNNHTCILEKLFFHSYKFLQENYQLSLVQKFNFVKCILYENELFYPRNIVFSLDTIILDYLFKVPDALKPYYSFLKLVGVAQSADYSHYSAVMSDLFKDRSLSNNRRKKIGRTTFLKFINTLRKAEDTGCCINLSLRDLMVLSNELEIVPVQDVVYVDNTRLKVHVQLFPDLSEKLNFLLDLPPNSLSSCEPPACLNIKHLSNLITETLDPNLRNSPLIMRYENERREIEYKLKCSTFAGGLIRIYNHSSKTNLSIIRIKNDSVKDVTKYPDIADDPLYLTCFEILQKLSVKVVSRLSIQITNISNGYTCIKMRDGIYDCFIEDSVLYVNGTNIKQFGFLSDLTYALNLQFANIFNDMLLQRCLSCENPCDIMGKLDLHNIQSCHFLDDISLPPSPVRPAPRVPIPTSSRVKPTGVTRSGLLQIIHGPTTATTPSTEVSSEDTFIAKLWMQTAQCDLMAAKKLVSGDLPPVFTSHACNNCFECAIKTCIAILYIHRYNVTNLSYERNLDILLSLVKRFFSEEVFPNFSSHCVSLMNFDDDSKNPLITPGIGCCIPMEQFSLKTADEAIKNASELIEIIKNEFPTMKKLMLSEDGQWIQPATSSLMLAQLESFQIKPNVTHEELLPISDEYSAVARNFMNTLPKATILCITKIHNKQCWDRFVAKVKLIISPKDSPKGTPDSKENTLLIKPLFHGSSGTDPDIIIRDPEGFKVEYANEGMWGRGIYFAQNASYSHCYAHKGNNTAELSMFLSKVFVGNAKFEKPNEHLLGPPPGYHSVTGTHPAGTKVYILYENGLAYPGYLIKYRQ